MSGEIGSTVAASCNAVTTQRKRSGKEAREQSPSKESAKQRRRKRGGEAMDMETILEETVATEDLKKFEQKYHTELNGGKVGNR